MTLFLFFFPLLLTHQLRRLALKLHIRAYKRNYQSEESLGFQLFLQYTFAEHCYFLPQNMSNAEPL